MALSEWPSDWEEEGDHRGTEIVTAEFDEDMYVAVVTAKAIGLKEEEDQKEISLWIPISEIDGRIPGRFSWISDIQIPKWLAEENDLDYR